MLTKQSFVVEQTGGGCTALVREQRDGTVLVVTDGNLGTDLGAYEPWDCLPNGALFSSVEDWEQGDDPVLEYVGSDVLAWATYVSAA